LKNLLDKDTGIRGNYVVMDQNKAREMPKPVPFIIFYALCERYSSMGVAGRNYI